ncbi:DUF1559 family PulG-like putative transporter [Schlesneria paludicola]|uniref:DUF1559 family PulG-like putative transporter n=1 Tax=Schlesneria paludicola TaxID=360056 RepID=UPI00029B0D08|nr:DUF1559 domain-containing protein [Schlesneria paludicola]
MWRQRVTVLVVILATLLIGSVLFPYLQKVREAARRMQTRNNLKQIGLALHNYHDTCGCLPPGGVFSSDREAFHGWMSSILPFLDSSPWYNSIDFNKPWDSSLNAGLFLKHHRTYENLGDERLPADGRDFAPAHFAANAHLMSANSCVRFTHIDHLEQVMLAAELAGTFVPWGCPYNWMQLENLDSHPATFCHVHGAGSHFLFADGHVEFVHRDISPDILKRMGGEDLSGFRDNRRGIQQPLMFLCPADALQISWELFNGRGTAVLRRNLNGDLLRLAPGDKGGWEADDSDFAIIATRYPKLEVLQARGRFHDVGVSSIRGLKHLRELSLHSNELTDNLFKTVGIFEVLEKLDLRCPQMTDAGIGTLKELQNLRELSLVSNQITEAGLLFTSELPNLKVLRILSAKMNSEAKERLQDSLPKCNVLLSPLAQ